MQYSILLTALVATVVSGSSLADLSNPASTGLTPACSTLFNTKLSYACSTIPSCSETCTSELEKLQANLILTCRQSDSAKGLLLAAINGNLVSTLCREDDAVMGTGSLSTTTATTKSPSSSEESSTSTRTNVQSTESTTGIAATTTTSTISTQTGIIDIDTSSVAGVTSNTATETDLLGMTPVSTVSSSTSKATSEASGSLFTTQPESNNAAAGKSTASLLLVLVAFIALI